MDIGFVQGGASDRTNIQKLISVGNIAYEPLLVFYRSGSNIRLLSGLAEKRLAIGSEGSESHSLALTLLQTNGLTADRTTQLLDLDADAAAQQLLAGTVDAVFMMTVVSTGTPSSTNALCDLKAVMTKLFLVTQFDFH
jgi:TRAP-type uncharacterized transport system substrate-binding protein